MKKLMKTVKSGRNRLALDDEDETNIKDVFEVRVRPDEDDFDDNDYDDGNDDDKDDDRDSIRVIPQRLEFEDQMEDEEEQNFAIPRMMPPQHEKKHTHGDDDEENHLEDEMTKNILESIEDEANLPRYIQNRVKGTEYEQGAPKVTVYTQMDISEGVDNRTHNYLTTPKWQRVPSKVEGEENSVDVRAEVQAMDIVQRCDTLLCARSHPKITRLQTPRQAIRCLAAEGALTCFLFMEVLKKSNNDGFGSIIIVRNLVRRYEKLRCIGVMLVFQSTEVFVPKKATTEDAAVVNEMSMMEKPARLVNYFFEVINVEYKIDSLINVM